jgi:hypothetical protein
VIGESPEDEEKEGRTEQAGNRIKQRRVEEQKTWESKLHTITRGQGMTRHMKPEGDIKGQGAME